MGTPPVRRISFASLLIAAYLVYGVVFVIYKEENTEQYNGAAAIVEPNIKSPLTNIEDFFDYVDLPRSQSPCKNLEVLGGRIYEHSDKVDGDKIVCRDPEFSLSENYNPNCVVLSFGNGDEWSFEESIEKLGCKVYVFDPTTDKEDHFRTSNIQFFNMGLSDKNETRQIGSKTDCKLDTYMGILKKLNLENSKIYYLKMDIEGDEVKFFYDVFKNYPEVLQNVEQIGMEIHPGRYEGDGKIEDFSVFSQLWKHFQELDQLGFKVLHARENRLDFVQYKWGGTTHSTCYEILWGRY